MKKEHNEKILTLPERLAAVVGELDAIEYPPQGTAFQVSILSSAQGRFVLKEAHTSAMVHALLRSPPHKCLPLTQKS